MANVVKVIPCGVSLLGGAVDAESNFARTAMLESDDALTETVGADDPRLARWTWGGSAGLHVPSDMPLAQPVVGTSFSAIPYPEFDAVEWQVRYSHPAAVTVDAHVDPSIPAEPGDSSIATLPSRVRLPTADFEIEFPNDHALTLHWARGSHAEQIDFRPEETRLVHGQRVTLESYGGRSSDGVMPYWRLGHEQGGVILAVGWAGDWIAEITAVTSSTVRVRIGMAHSPFATDSDESVRLPSLVIMNYRGNDDAGRNQLRRFLRQHMTPGEFDSPSRMPVAASVHGMFAFNDTTADRLVEMADQIGGSSLPIDVFWLDAGWNEGGFPHGQGNPCADPIRYPQGLAPVGRKVAERGLQFLVWFEPERAMRGTWIDRTHPVWVLQPHGTPESLRYLENDGFRLFDLGQPAAREWMLESISREITESNIGIYRQDFNSYPQYFWNSGDDTMAAGLREVRHIGGLYELWDRLRARHPGLVIDNCASGGRRLDFESMRRSLVLWRSDSCWDDKSYPRNVQAMEHGLSHWLPYHGLGSVAVDPLSLRSGMGTCASFAIDYRNQASVDALRKHLQLYKPIRHLFAEDYYPLADWSVDPKVWLAYQFHSPTTGDGIVQVFSGESSEPGTFVAWCRGLDAASRYRCVDWDQPDVERVFSGRELMAEGRTFRSQGGARAWVVHYKKMGRE